MSLLQQIQVTAQQIAEAIAGVLDIEVTIADDSLVRIAGTGYHYDTIGKQIDGKSMYHKVLASKREYVISDVSTDSECGDCERRGVCKELAELCCPILVGSRVIGVIGLIAFSPERQAELRNKNERLLTFIRHMAELLAAKAVEVDSFKRAVLLKNQLETVINFISEGILAIDHTAKIISMNYSAEQMLEAKARDFVGFHINEVFPGTPIPEVLRDGVGFTNREVSIWQKGKHHHYLIHAKPMVVDGMVQGVVASFWAANDIKGSSLRDHHQAPIMFSSIVGSSKALTEVKTEAAKAASTSSTVLIIGESGTGKELFAQAIHNESSRAFGPFVAINCAAIPENLLESELFGYAEGSFTGARKGGKPGKFQLAQGGTLFLDEIGDMPLLLQSKILRVLQEKSVEPVGGVKSVPIDVRIIAATNQPLEELVKSGKFREDLYYRLNVFLLTLPPLRERVSDVRELAHYFLHKHILQHEEQHKILSEEAKQVLEAYEWPGNIRELENAIECATVRSNNDSIQIADLPQKIVALAASQAIKCQCEQKFHEEKTAIIAALKEFGSTVPGKQQAAAKLGMGIATLYRKMKKYGI
ncbi:MAG: sigma 54-interacting transcriptional regulator [Sporomusaceae bacterium]|nr:sigma 54-interacting transcriptional regulator [Sporomusaceae bacterium]